MQSSVQTFCELGLEELLRLLRLLELSSADEALARATLEAGDFNPKLGLVCHDGNAPLALLYAALRPDRRLSIWTPRFDRRCDPQTRRSSADRLLERLLALAFPRRAHFDVIEARPGEDEANYQIWIDALCSAGFNEAACAHLYILDPLPKTGEASSGPAGLDVLPYTENLKEAFVELHASALQNTLDRRMRLTLESPEVDLQRFQQFGDGPFDPSLWLLLRRDTQDCGYVLSCLMQEPPFEGTSAYVLEIAVATSHRGSGIGGLLLQCLLDRLARTPARRLLAFIDDQNIPSVRLHRRLGFVMLPERHMAYRREGVSKSG